MVRELLPRFAMFICCMDWYRIADQGLFAAGGDHANEMETSLMQYLRPDWVLPLSEAGSGREHKFKMAALREGWVWTQRDWTQATDDTGIGDPRQATPEKGRRCLEQVAAQLAEFLVELAAADLETSTNNRAVLRVRRPRARGDRPTRNRGALGGRAAGSPARRGVLCDRCSAARLARIGDDRGCVCAGGAW